MLVVGVEHLSTERQKLTRNNGTGGKENMVNWHHHCCIVEFRGLIQEPRAEGTY